MPSTKGRTCSLLFMKMEPLKKPAQFLCTFLLMLLETSCGLNIIDIYIRCRFILWLPNTHEKERVNRHTRVSACIFHILRRIAILSESLRTQQTLILGINLWLILAHCLMSHHYVTLPGDDVRLVGMWSKHDKWLRHASRDVAGGPTHGN